MATCDKIVELKIKQEAALNEEIKNLRSQLQSYKHAFDQSSNKKSNPEIISAWKSKVQKGKTEIQDNLDKLEDYFYLLGVEFRIDMLYDEIDDEIDRASSPSNGGFDFAMDGMMEPLLSELKNHINNILKNPGDNRKQLPPGEVESEVELELDIFLNKILEIAESMIIRPTEWDINSQTISLQDENMSLLISNNSLSKANKELFDENQALSAQLEESNSPLGKPLTQRVFPYVNWNRVNKSKNWYKDVDWSTIPFDYLSAIEIENIDWSKLNYNEAGQSKSFAIDFIDWAEVNSAGKAQTKVYKDLAWQSIDYAKLSDETKDGIDWSRIDYREAIQSSSFDISIIDWGEVNSAKNIKKIYKDLNWESVDYGSLNDEVKEEIDWVRVDYIEAIRSESFSLDSIDIAELKNNQRVFKKFIKNTGLRKSGADSLLNEASSETLQTIGLNSYAGRIPGKMIKSFSTNSGQYKLVMRPSSHLRASAIAKGMGGKLAEFETASESNDFVDELTGLLADRALSRKLSKTTAPDGSSGSYLWLGGSDKSTEGDWKWLSSGDSIEESRQEWGTKVDDDSKEPDNLGAAHNMNITQNSLAHGLWDLSILKPGGQWVDLIETNNLWFVVEMN